MVATVKIPDVARAHLAELAAERKQPMGEVLAELIERERRRRFFEEYDAAFARLKADPEAWADWQAELKGMEGTLMDGLEDDPWVE
ncbi:MAG: toxin-antitoxin system protein [Thermomicrobiales bacterium]